MSFFHHANPTKLAANQDLHGLVNCVTGKDQAVARQAAPLLAALVDDSTRLPAPTRCCVTSRAMPNRWRSTRSLRSPARLQRSSHVKASAAQPCTACARSTS